MRPLLLLLLLPLACALVPMRPETHEGWLMHEYVEGSHRYLAAYWDLYHSSVDFSFGTSVDIANTTANATRRQCTLDLQCVGYHYLGAGLARLFIGRGNTAPQNDGAGYIKSSAVQFLNFTAESSPSPDDYIPRALRVGTPSRKPTSDADPLDGGATVAMNVSLANGTLLKNLPYRDHVFGYVPAITSISFHVAPNALVPFPVVVVPAIDPPVWMQSPPSTPLVVLMTPVIVVASISLLVFIAFIVRRHYQRRKMD